MILNADARSIPLADKSVQCCVTSPPYWGLRDYGHSGQIGLEQTPDEYVAQMVAVFREVRRVLRDDGTLWLNLGDSYSSGGMSNPSSKSTLGGGKDRGASGYLISRSAPAGLKPKDLVGIPWRVAFALQADGWYLRQDIIWHKPNPMPESVTDRCTKAHEYVFLLSKSARYYYDAEAVKEANSETSRTGGTYRTSASKNKQKGNGHSGICREGFVIPRNGRNRRSVWTVATRPYKGAHFATFPPQLIEPCILAGCPVGGIVLDPFGGSGTTGMVAAKHGRKAVLLELNPGYLPLAQERTKGVQTTLVSA